MRSIGQWLRTEHEQGSAFQRRRERLRQNAELERRLGAPLSSARLSDAQIAAARRALEQEEADRRTGKKAAIAAGVGTVVLGLIGAAVLLRRGEADEERPAA